jgi:hypothetical protein
VLKDCIRHRASKTLRNCPHMMQLNKQAPKKKKKGFWRKIKKVG